MSALPPAAALPGKTTSNGQVKAQAPHRRGKIARLPKLLRDQINQMLRDGCSYQQIIEKLKESPEIIPFPISNQNLSRWKRGGYQEWLAQQEWREEMHSRQDDAVALLRDSEAPKLYEATLQLAAMRGFELLKRLEASTLSANLQDLPPACLRLLAVLPRIAREALRYQKYRDACVQARAHLQPLRETKRKLSDAERRTIVNTVDEILGLACPTPPAPDGEAGHESPSPGGEGRGEGEP